VEHWYEVEWFASAIWLLVDGAKAVFLALATGVLQVSRFTQLDTEIGLAYQFGTLMIGPAKIYFIVFGLLTIIGGVMGYVKAGSTISLISGSVAGIVLLIAAWVLPSNVMLGLALAGVVSILLAGRFVPIFIKTGKMMPAGLMAVLSVIGVIVAILAWMKR
jgi:uncharacterized membrane protein (UPF0136 family)